MARRNLRPESWRAYPGWEVSAVSSCLVMRDLVRYAGPSSVGSSFGTGAGILQWLLVRVEMGSGVGRCGVPRITFRAWIGGKLGATLGDWIGGMIGATLEDWIGGNVGANRGYWAGGIAGITCGEWVGLFVGASRGDVQSLV